MRVRLVLISRGQDGSEMAQKWPRDGSEVGPVAPGSPMCEVLYRSSGNDSIFVVYCLGTMPAQQRSAGGDTRCSGALRPFFYSRL